MLKLQFLVPISFVLIKKNFHLKLISVTRQHQTRDFIYFLSDLKVLIDVLIHDPEVDHDLLEIDDTIVLQIYFLEQLLKKTIVKPRPQQRSRYISTL